MKITLLGTGSPLPHPDRAGPATLLQHDGTNLLVDCGRGVVMRLAAAGLIPGLLHGVLLTHLHSDHLTDLNDLLTTHWVMSPPGAALRIVGPPGTARVVAATLEMLALDCSYRIAHHADLEAPPAPEVTEVAPGDRLELGGLTVAVGATDHRPVTPSVAYRVGEGRHCVVVAGDTVPCASLDELCAGAGALVQTVIRDDLVRLVPSERLQDILDYHSTVAQAAETARRAGVGALVLTHYVPPMAPGSEEEWRQLASGFPGPVVLGDDLTSVELDGST